MTVYGDPSSNVFYRKLRRDYPRIVRGEGCYLYDANGRRYLDGSGGAFVANLGHGVEEVADAIGAEARRLGYVSGMTFTHDAVEELAREIGALCPGDLDLVYPLSSGSEAVEASLKLARQYWVETGHSSKKKIIALQPGYHGNTLLALSASAREHYKIFFQPWLVDVVHVPAPYPYRCQCRGVHPLCPACSGEAIEAAILREDPETVAAVIGEPVGGSSSGASTPLPQFWRRVRETCDRHQVLWIADEVLTGAGRTGTWSALEPYGAIPDLMTLGKGLSGGYVPLSALVAPRGIVDAIAGGSGALLHAQTFSHHPTTCAGGVAAIRYLRERGLVRRCATIGTLFHERLAALRESPMVGDVRGRGLLAGIELVADKDTRAPFPRTARIAERVAEAALEAGLVLWPNAGLADGANGDVVMLAPPFVITEEQVDELVHLLTLALLTVGAREEAPT
jgi:adenosylmethionine-8-amino-7-oxononanoate aminotransferase